MCGKKLSLFWLSFFVLLLLAFNRSYGQEVKPIYTEELTESLQILADLKSYNEKTSQELMISNEALRIVEKKLTDSEQRIKNLEDNQTYSEGQIKELKDIHSQAEAELTDLKKSSEQLKKDLVSKEIEKWVTVAIAVGLGWLVGHFL